MLKIAWLGTGAMGLRMTRKLIDAGHPVTAWNRTPEHARPLVDAGASLAATPREAATGADIVISMVRDNHASAMVWSTRGTGAIAGLGESAIAVEASTVTPGWIRELAMQVGERCRGLVDAPVLGSLPQAEAGQLITLAGADDHLFETCEAVFACYSGAVHHVGGSGCGSRLKLAANTLFATQVAALAECLGVLEKSGIDCEDAVDVMTQLPVFSPAVAGAAQLIKAGRHAPLFPIELVEKDLGYQQDLAADFSASAPLAATVRQIYLDAMQRGLGADNITGVARSYLATPDS